MPVQKLSEYEINELASPFDLDGTASLGAVLSFHVDLAVRTFAMMLREDKPGSGSLHDRDFIDEFKRVAADPARALNSAPATDGAHKAREMIEYVAATKNIDLETRAGAAAIGDVASRYLAMPKTGRVGDDLRLAEDVLFEHLCRTIRAIFPSALDALPPNEALGKDIPRAKPLPIIAFSMAFIQIVHDRAVQMLDEPSSRVRDRLTALLNKSDRRLLDGIRKERQYHRRNKAFGLEGTTQAMILE